MIKNFLKVVAGGFCGGVCGSLTGFILMFLVRGLVALTFLFSGTTLNAEVIQPLAVFSIGGGTVLGGIFGAIFMLKKTKDQN